MKVFILKIQLIIILILSLHLSVIGQRAKVSLSENNTSQNISAHSYFLQDHDCALDPSLVLAGQFDDQFKRNNDESYSFGNIHTTYWHKITLEVTDTAHKWYLIINNHHIDSINFYIPDTSGDYRIDRSGRLVPYDDRSVEFNKFAFEIPINSVGTTTIYIRLTSYFLNYQLQVMRDDVFKTEYTKRRFTFGLLLGFLVMIALYNFFIYFSVRDKKYLFYILYVFLSIIKISDTNGNMDPLWQGSLSFMRTQSPGLTILSSLSVTLFAYHFLNFRKYIPGAIKVIFFLLVPIWTSSLFFNAIDIKLYSSIINQVKTIIEVVFILTCAIMVYRRGYKPARYYIIAEIFLFTGILLYPLATMGLFPFRPWIENSLELGAGIEILFFSFALADMINEFKKEKQKAENELVQSLKENEKIIKEQNRLLEIKVEERTKDLEVEKAKSDSLLLNILPAEVAAELKINGETQARKFKHATIMFTDFVNFSDISSNLDPIELVDEIHKCFTVFDKIIEEHDLEKIKTIGDAYLAVCGLPREDPRHAEKVLKAAFAIRQYIEDHNRQNGLFDIRIGIHTGPLVAGVVGVKKFAYDIWGDSVNIASRMGNASERGKVNLSQTTYDLVKEICDCTFRGKIPIKNRGEVDMYYAEPKK